MPGSGIRRLSRGAPSSKAWWGAALAWWGAFHPGMALNLSGCPQPGVLHGAIALLEP